ncbi:hypothetical protein B0H19DRAFT_1080087 [Mycena capillaripes]|nr:hypothetical protein B0H19DRAFT_1080087 [Mycena capillaripes]
MVRPFLGLLFQAPTEADTPPRERFYDRTVRDNKSPPLSTQTSAIYATIRRGSHNAAKRYYTPYVLRIGLLSWVYKFWTVETQDVLCITVVVAVTALLLVSPPRLSPRLPLQTSFWAIVQPRSACLRQTPARHGRAEDDTHVLLPHVVAVALAFTVLAVILAALEIFVIDTSVKCSVCHGPPAAVRCTPRREQHITSALASSGASFAKARDVVISIHKSFGCGGFPLGSTLQDKLQRLNQVVHTELELDFEAASPSLAQFLIWHAKILGLELQLSFDIANLIGRQLDVQPRYYYMHVIFCVIQLSSLYHCQFLDPAKGILGITGAMMSQGECERSFHFFEPNRSR